ncbi:DUF4870 domain-containing protein [Actinomycetaceae bacterium L2_0104]
MKENSSFGHTPNDGEDPRFSGNGYGAFRSGGDNAWGDPNPETFSFDEARYDRRGIHGDPQPGDGELSREDDKTFAILAALSIPVGLLFSLGWLGFAGPLIIWLIYRDRSPFLREAAARAFNFQLGMTIANVVAWVLIFTLVLIPVSIIIWLVIFVLSLYYPIRATMAATNYRLFNYPFSIGILS